MVARGDGTGLRSDEMMKRCWAWLVVLVVASLVVADSAFARKRTARRRAAAIVRSSSYYIPARLAPSEFPPAGPYVSALLIDADTGRFLFEKDASELRPPASMVKMMVALITLEAIRSGELSLGQSIRISKLASRTGGSGVSLRTGEVLSLDELLRAMLVASANGASVAIAEGTAGSQEAMVDRMNERARELGMFHTRFHTVCGLPPRARGGLPDMTSASDLAILARKLLEHKEVLQYTARELVPFRGGTVLLRNTNHLVGHMEGADGLKTGYYGLAGFNLTATAERDGLRLIAIVLGCPTLRSRFQVAQELMEWGFANYSKLQLVRAGEPLALEVKVQNGGTTTSLRPVAADDLVYLIRNGESRDLHVSFQVPPSVSAPIHKDQEIGEIIVRDRTQVLDVIPAIAPSDVKTAPIAVPSDSRDRERNLRLY
jgi:D-alanyl-D-alanine carboxypeptidase (penicillin-binding protein 5/6)